MVRKNTDEKDSMPASYVVSQERTMEKPIFSRLRSAAPFRLEELLNNTCRYDTTRRTAVSTCATRFF